MYGPPPIQLKDIIIPNFWHVKNRQIAISFVELMKEFGFDYLEIDNKFIYENEYVTIEPNDIVVDCGANIGIISAWAAARGASKIYSFEPDKIAYEHLCLTAELHNNITPVNKAIGATEGQLYFIETQNPMGSHFSKCDINQGAGIRDKHYIDVVSLDRYFNNQKIDFIKIDCEGAERDILLGAQNIIQQHAPKIIMAGYHLDDDLEILPKILKAINSNYNIICENNMYFCWVDKS